VRGGFKLARGGENIERRAAHSESVDIVVSINSIQWIYLPLRTLRLLSLRL
jgi:hypothetical protein